MWTGEVVGGCGDVRVGDVGDEFAIVDDDLRDDGETEYQQEDNDVEVE